MSDNERADVRPLSKHPNPEGLAAFSRMLNDRRKKRPRHINLAESFADAVRTTDHNAKYGPKEDRADARFLSGHLRRCAKQNLRPHEFQQFKKLIAKNT